MSSSRTFARAAGFIAIAGMLSRVLGFVREQIMAYNFGLSGTTDAYFAAFTIPDILYNLLVGGALSAAFIPVFSEYLVKDGDKEAWKVASIMVNLVLVLSIVGSVLGIIFAPSLLPLVAYKLEPQYRDLAVTLTRIIFPSVIFTAFNGLQMGILNSYHHFKAPALGSLMYNVGIITLGVLLTPYIGIEGFAYGVIFGVILSFMIQMPALNKHGFSKWFRINLNIFHPGVKKIFFLTIPVMLALSVNQINLVVNQNIASALEPGNISALRLANRIMMLPLGVFGSAIAVAIFPSMTNFAAKKQIDEFKGATSLGLRSTFFVVIPASVGLIALGLPLVRLMFQHGNVTPSAAINTANVLAFYALGIFAQAGTLVIIRAFYALQDTWTPLTFGVVTIALNYFMNVALVEPLGAKGIAFAYSVTGLFDFVTLTVLLRRKIGRINLKQIISTFGKVLVASVIMGLTAYLTAGLLEHYLNINLVLFQLVQVLVSIAVAVVVYFVIVTRMKLEEAQVVIGILKRRFART